MELSHTLEVKPNWYIRLFLWFYQVDRPYNLNTCKLFWGSIGLVVIPIILLVLSPIIGLIALAAWGLNKLDRALKRSNQRRRDTYDALPEETKVAIANKKSWRSVMLDKISLWGSIAWYKVQTPLSWFVRYVLGLAVLVGLAFLIYWAINAVPTIPWNEVVDVLWHAALVAIAAFVILLVIVLPLFWLKAKMEARPKKVKRPSVIKAMFASIHDHTCANIKVVDDAKVASEEA